MATLTFQQALSRGMLPKAKTAQEELMSLAGGMNTFKSEDWWNKAVDKQISKGYGQKETGKEYLTKSGEYVLGRRTKLPSQMYDFSGPKYAYKAPKDAVITGYTQSRGNVLYGYTPKKPIYETREIDVFGKDGTEYFTSKQLKDIQKSSKEGAEQVKKTVAATKASKKRLSRATGGLMGKAKVGAPEIGPALGTTGLGMEDSILGGGIKL